MKPIPKTFKYYHEMTEAKIQGDAALAVFGKSELEDDENNFWWEPIDRQLLPWRLGGIVTTKGRFRLCAMPQWWVPKTPSKLFEHLSGAHSIENSKTIRLWMVPCHDNDATCSKYGAEGCVALEA